MTKDFTDFSRLVATQEGHNVNRSAMAIMAVDNGL